MLEKLGIDMITIALPFRLNHVNCFFAESEKGYIIMDTGLNNGETKAKWEEVIKQKQVSQIIITHLHPDHSGYAGNLQLQTSAKLTMTKTDSEAMKVIWKEQSLSMLQRDYKLANVPQKIADGIIAITRDFLPFVTPNPKVNHYLQEGEMIQIGKECYEVIFTPGHSQGLVCFYNREHNVLFSTDHILPKITPNISYWFYGEKNPLLSYERSLKKMKQFNIDYVIPSHGMPFFNANKRIEEIWQHHLDRFNEILDVLHDGTTIFTVCEKIFPQQLSVYEYQFAIGETIAHLEYLRAKEEVQRELQKGKWIYYKG